MTALTTQTIDKVRAGLKPALGISANDNSRDAELNAYITRANALAEAYLGFPLEPGTYTVTLQYQRSCLPLLIPFDRLDVTGILSVTMDGAVIGAASGIWYFDRAAMALRFRGVYFADVLEIQYTAGGSAVSDVLIEALVIFSSVIAGKAATSAMGIPATGVSSVDIPGLYRVTFREGGTVGAVVPVEAAALLDTVRVGGI